MRTRFIKLTDAQWQLDRVNECLELIVADGSYRVEITQRPESTTGFVPQKGRWQVERSFAWLNAYRRLSREYEKRR
jgi:putative transposase